ncbi:hypothetical protein [Formosa algae]|uniref:STAS/SEC14 domain-containing protein n=1 Tax=Formosa algae TaxID=225843 RepID=A0A9X1CB44_9FLAO|nr:hypothetical protein [Formosa algae]MBP1839672.1 hypothetical protein [Formosa algae]MDQ0334976.1 hypothetical protein [Formosa algae]OEI81604.1 hypothetical protein AST99_03230 [Formosa algae]PNW28923.1 hypothetical protein BKP44_06690 [Formosa algae]
MKRLLTYDFGSLKLYGNYVLAEINEGATITVKDNAILVNVAENYYEGRPFAYISYRKYSYAVDPAVYIEASKIENLIGFAIVTNIPTAINNTKIERLFSKKLHKTFEVISEAKIWANFIVKKYKKAKKHAI